MWIFLSRTDDGIALQYDEILLIIFNNDIGILVHVFSQNFTGRSDNIKKPALLKKTCQTVLA